ncbi:outer membrane protein [Parabacteroides sp.]
MRKKTVTILGIAAAAATLSVSTARAEIIVPLERYPMSKARFTMQIYGAHDTGTPWLSAQSLSVYGNDGQPQSSEAWTGEQVDEDNRSVSHGLVMNSISLRLSYRLWDNLSLWAGIGTTNFTHEETFRDDDRLSSSTFSKNMAPIYSGGLGYGYALTDRLFVSAQPGVRYANSGNMTSEVYYQGETIPLRDLSLRRRYLEWTVPVVVGYALGNLVPYAGILYKDYAMRDRYEFTKTYAGEDYTVRIDETFRARHKLYALAGANYFLADNISIGLNGSFGKRQSVQLQFNISF